MGIILTGIFIEQLMGLHGLFFVGDIDGVAALCLWGGVIFSLGSILLLRVEKIKKPKIIDHFRQTSIFYLLFTIGFLVIYPTIYKILTLPYYSPGQGAAIFFILVAVAFMGILTNAVTLFLSYCLRNKRPHT
jgi:hypothetical protein